MDEEFYKQNDENRTGSWKDAMRSVEEMDLAMTLALPPIIRGLHPRANDQYKRTFESLQEQFPDIGKLVAYSQWVMWASCWEGAHWYRRSIDTGVIRDTDAMRRGCTPEGYAATEGWAYASFNKMSELSFAVDFGSVLSKFGYASHPDDDAVLTAMELHWLWQASEADLPKPKFLEAIHEASEAGSLANGLHMWRESEKLVLESIEVGSDSPAALTARRLLAKMAAQARHAPGQAVREAVRARFLTERSAYSSKDAAAIAYTKDYPFEFSTIRDWLKGV